MERYVVTVLPGGRITIPTAIRRSLELQPGDALIWWWEGRELRFRKAQSDKVICDHDGQPTDDVPSLNIDHAPEQE